MKKLLIVSLLILSLLFSLPVSAVPLADIHLNGPTVDKEITIDGTALPNTWVSLKITDQDKNIVSFSGVKTGEDSKYSFDLDLIGSSLPLDVTITYGDNIETFQMKGEEPAPVDKEALNNKIEDAESLTESDYTEETWAELEQALETAQAVADNQEATQEEVDNSLKALEAAIDGLKKKGTDPAPEEYDLVIRGRGVSETTYFTIEQLKDAPGLRKVAKTYKWLNSFGSTGSDTFEGVYLENLLDDVVKLKSDAKSITVRASDGYKRSFNLDSKPLGVYWTDIQGNQIMLAWKQNGSSCGLRLVIGQTDKDHVNKSMWVSDIVEITVNTTSTDPGSGTPGGYEGEQEEEELIEEIDDKQTSETINVTLNVAPKISGNTAISSILASDINNILQEIEKMQPKEDKDYKIVVKVNAVSEKQLTKAEVSLTAEVVRSLEKQQNVWVRIMTDLGEIELSPQILKELSIGSSDINISLTHSGDKTLSNDIKDKIAERPIVDITITKGNQNHTDFSGNPIKAAIPYKAKPAEDRNKLLVYFINNKGQSRPLKLSKFDHENNSMKFQTTHLSLYAVGYNETYFDDVKDHWAKTNIEFLASREIVKGKSAVQFDPNGNVTRAEFVTMLVNCTDKDIAKSVSEGFDDVATGAWYFDDINWAVKEGIVKGYGNGRFGPNDVITREQMAVMTDNFIKAMKARLDIVNKKTGFTDQEKINSWSAEAVANMQQFGIIKGKTSGSFDPQGTATRAEAATILKGYIDSLLK